MVDDCRQRLAGHPVRRDFAARGAADDLAFALGSPSDSSGPKPADIASPPATEKKRKKVDRDEDEPERGERTRRRRGGI